MIKTTPDRNPAESEDIMKFYDNKHECAYREICNEMKYLDCYHHALAYLLTLDKVLREHIEDVYDFKDDVIKIEGLHREWQDGTSLKTTRLAFNLWNGCADEGEVYVDKDGYKIPLPSDYYTPEKIFCSGYAPYFWEAIKLRYPEYTEE